MKIGSLVEWKIRRSCAKSRVHVTVTKAKRERIWEARRWRRRRSAHLAGQGRRRRSGRPQGRRRLGSPRSQCSACVRRLQMMAHVNMETAPPPPHKHHLFAPAAAAPPQPSAPLGGRIKIHPLAAFDMAYCGGPPAMQQCGCCYQVEPECCWQCCPEVADDSLTALVAAPHVPPPTAAAAAAAGTRAVLVLTRQGRACCVVFIFFTLETFKFTKKPEYEISIGCKL